MPKPVIWEVAEMLAVVYWTLYRRQDSTLETALDALHDAIAELDTMVAGIPLPDVRRVLDDQEGALPSDS